MKQNSDKCVNVNENFEKRIYMIGDTKYIVRVFSNPDKPISYFEHTKRLIRNNSVKKN